MNYRFISFLFLLVFLFSFKNAEKFTLVNEVISITVCDDDFDGIVEFDLEEIRTQVSQQLGETGIQEDLVYIAQSYYGLQQVNNVSTNPVVTNVCAANMDLFEVAVDQNQDVYISSRQGVYLANLDNCSYQFLGDLPYNSNVAMSFDTQNNLYVGGFHTSIYRADAGQFTNFYEWHNFGVGSSGGDFVVIGDFMYIAWAIDSEYYIYKVTLDADNQYVSHENLGEIDERTYGLAAENGRLYGVTPDYLYEIDLETMQTNRIINNSSSIPWYGAAGLHEAIEYEISFHLTDNEAQTGDNPLDNDFTNTQAFNQIVYIRVLNETTGDVDIINLELTVNTPPETQPTPLVECSGSQQISFNLNEAIPNMISDTSGITITFHTTENAADIGNNAIQNAANFQPASLPMEIYVRFYDGDCYAINIITLNSDIGDLDIENNQTFCSGSDLILEAPTGFDAYLWQGLSATDLANNDIDSNTVTVTESGSYTVTVYYGNDCELSETIDVVEEDAPDFNNEIYAFCASESVEEISVSDVISYLNSINSNVNFTLFLNENDAENNENQLTGIISVENDDVLIVKIRNSASSVCFILQYITIQFLEKPDFSIESEYKICEGESVEISLPTGFNSYHWIGLQGIDAENNVTIGNAVIITHSGTYAVTVSNGNCETTKEFSVNFNPSVQIINIEIDGNNATVIATGSDNLEYSLNGMDWSQSATFSDLENGVFTAYVRADDLCGIAEQNFSLFFISNVITPNNDGYNDVWSIKGIQNYPESSLQIYDRYGKLIVERNTENEILWDGTQNGNKVPSGTYWYVIKISDGRNLSGHITVKNY